MRKGILRPKIHQDQTGKLHQNMGREQDPPYCTSDTGNEGLQPLQQLQIPLKIIKVVLDPVSENIQYSEERGKKIKFLFKDFHGLSHINEPQSCKTQVTDSWSW